MAKCQLCSAEFSPALGAQHFGAALHAFQLIDFHQELDDWVIEPKSNAGTADDMV